MREDHRMKRRHGGASVLTGIAPFDRCTDRELEPLREHADRLAVREGSTVARAGEVAREFVVVLRGEVVSMQGDTVVTLGPGAELGGDEVLAGAVHPRTLLAGRDLELLVVNGPAYRWAVQSLTRFHAAA